MEWDKGDLIVGQMALQVQVYDVVKGADPTTCIRICGGDKRKTTNGETARVVSGGVGRVRKRLLPQVDVGWGGEFDAGEEVFSRPMDP